MKLVIIIPALNEARTIGEVIQRIPRQIPDIRDIQIVVIDDGSSDATAERAKEVGADVVQHHTNRGVGIAFKSGVEYALTHGADLMVNMDADGQFSPEDIPTLIHPIVVDEADFVTTTRFAKKEYFPDGIPPMKLFGNRVYAKLISSIIGKRFTDVSCGFRAYNREALLRMTLFGAFTYTQETFLDLAGKNIRMQEIPLRVRGQRAHGKSRLASNLFHFGFKTISIMLRAIRDLAPFRFFGGMGMFLTFLGVLIEACIFIYWITTHRTTPFQNLMFVGFIILVLGFLLIIVALLADMMYRQRRIQEEILYYNRKKVYFPLPNNVKSERGQEQYTT